MDTTTIRVREPRELLALLPFQLGFQPEDSAVAVALRAPRGRVGLIARVDLTDLAEPDLGPPLARRLVTHLVGDGAAQAVLVLYAAHDPRPWAADRPQGGGDPCGDLCGDLCSDPCGDTASIALRAVDHFRLAAAAFLGEVAVWVVAPTGYLALDCDDPGCCPAGGRPLRELQSTEVGAHMVLAGAMVADSRATLVPDLPAPARARRNAVRAARRATERRRRAAAAGVEDLAAWREQALRTWRVHLRAHLDAAPRTPPRDRPHDHPHDHPGASWDGHPDSGPAARPAHDPAPSAAALGRIAAALDDVLVRDAVLLTLVEHSGDLPERSVAGPAGPPADDGVLARGIADALAAVVSVRDGVPPQPDALRAATVLLERVVAHAGGAQRAPALTLLGLLAWWSGDGARAGVLIERALGADPAHRLAHLLGEALAAGLAPGWVRTDGR